MSIQSKKQFSGKWILLYLGAYFILNLLFLSMFPMMHSDESWLSGLTRAMMTNGPGTTEPFFDLMPRFPHAIKLLFHALQMPFITVFGYNLFAVRLISLLFGTATLYMFYRLCARMFGSSLKALVMTAILSLDVQFIYASHFARQDIIITFGIVAVTNYITAHAEYWSYKRDIAMGIIVGLFIGFHPNSLMVALTAGALYVYYITVKRIRLMSLALLVGVVAALAGVFIGISYAFDPLFLPHYFKYGSTLGVNMSLIEKMRYFPGYFIKLLTRISGTYYTPPVQPQLILFGIGAATSAVLTFWKRGVLRPLLPLLAVCIGIIVIGRYSQPAVILLFPLGWLVVFHLAEYLPRIGRIIVYGVLCAVMLINSLIAIIPYLNTDYRDYLDDINASVPTGSRTLANLNAEYAFDCGDVLDVRNLQYLEDNDLDFEQYVRSQGIEYIVYAEEMDYIYKNRPIWNIIYGNVVPYYDDMQTFLQDECTDVASFTSPYAMRIIRHAYAQNWTVTVYRVQSKETP